MALLLVTFTFSSALPILVPFFLVYLLARSLSFSLFLCTCRLLHIPSPGALSPRDAPARSPVCPPCPPGWRGRGQVSPPHPLPQAPAPRRLAPPRPPRPCPLVLLAPLRLRHVDLRPGVQRAGAQRDHLADLRGDERGGARSTGPPCGSQRWKRRSAGEKGGSSRARPVCCGVPSACPPGAAPGRGGPPPRLPRPVQRRRPHHEGAGQLACCAASLFFSFFLAADACEPPC